MSRSKACPVVEDMEKSNSQGPMWNEPSWRTIVAQRQGTSLDKWGIRCAATSHRPGDAATATPVNLQGSIAKANATRAAITKAHTALMESVEVATADTAAPARAADATAKAATANAQDAANPDDNRPDGSKALAIINHYDNDSNGIMHSAAANTQKGSAHDNSYADAWTLVPPGLNAGRDARGVPTALQKLRLELLQLLHTPQLLIQHLQPLPSLTTALVRVPWQPIQIIQL